MKINFLQIFLLILIISCNRPETENTVIIHGVVTNGQGQKILLEEMTIKKIIPVDSVFMEKNGSFEFEISPHETGFYLLNINDKFIILLLEEGEKINLTADIEAYPEDYTITGSEGSELLWDYFHKSKKNELQLDSLSKIFIENDSREDFYKIRESLDSAYSKVYKEQQTVSINLIKNNLSSIASLLILNKKFGNQVLLDDVNHFDLYQKLDSVLFEKYPDNTNVIDHHERVIKKIKEQEAQKLANERLSIGNQVPVINLPDIHGNPVNLSSVEGKYKLLYFWAAWSAPCRLANQTLPEIYKKYKNKGLNIYAVSFDTNKKIWEAAIKIDKLDWLNVSDLKGINSPVRKLFNIPEKLPYFYIVDKKLKIIYKCDNTNELINKIENLFEQ